MKTNKNITAFLVIGALGVGKSTICNELAKNFSSEKNPYIHIDLDAYIGKLKKMEVKEYFGKVGYEKFYEESNKIIRRLYFNHIKKKSKKILLIDVGSGSTFDYKSISLNRDMASILLTADPEYLFEREKCQTSHKELGYYKFWQFGKEKEQLYSQCKIKIDVAYLNVTQIADIMDNKIKGFQTGRYF